MLSELLWCVWQDSVDGRKERTVLRTSQIYCRVSNFRLSTYLSETLIKKKLVCKKEGRTLAKSARAQRGRRLRAIDPTSICSLCAAIDQTGERPGEPEHTAPNQNEIENNLVHTHTRAQSRANLVYVSY